MGGSRGSAQGRCERGHGEVSLVEVGRRGRAREADLKREGAHAERGCLVRRTVVHVVSSLAMASVWRSVRREACLVEKGDQGGQRRI